jgi:hypothetical protein
MYDYSKGENLASDIITDKIRVSTAMFPGDHGNGFETWIFSDDARQNSVQIWHRTKQAALKVHRYVTQNMRQKYCA